MVGLIGFAGQVAEALKATEQNMNTMNNSFQQVGNDLHVPLRPGD